MTTESASPMPQANDLKAIRRALDAYVTHQDWEAAWRAMGVAKYTRRQVGYYRNALKSLGLIGSDQQLTDVGRQYAESTPLARLSLFEQCVQSHPAVAAAHHARARGSDTLQAVIEHFKASHPNYSDATYTRRAASVVAWLNWTKGTSQ